jgi:hypothetical protein
MQERNCAFVQAYQVATGVAYGESVVDADNNNNCRVSANTNSTRVHDSEKVHGRWAGNLWKAKLKRRAAACRGTRHATRRREQDVQVRVLLAWAESLGFDHEEAAGMQQAMQEYATTRTSPTYPERRPQC